MIVAATLLPVAALLTTGAGVAGAVPVFPGNVTCNSSGGVWQGVVSFTPPLSNAGAAGHETIKLKAKLGNTTSPCVSTTTNPGFVVGAIAGKAKYSATNANNCSTLFSGSALSPSAAKFKIKWVAPHGVPTKWVQPAPFAITGASNMGSITFTGGSVTGSFVPVTGQTMTLSDTTWPAATGPVATGCSSTGGLHSLVLGPSTGTSTGTW
ncbi:MAG TPA: hypothetical protein VMF60_00525 [Acidimicrobiales bacterium]|nr:hypothetical protein [Acidimicrobiales bacterium]